MTRPHLVPTQARGLTDMAPRLIELAIHGPDLVLAGKFEHWVPVAIETGGGESEAQVLFDVTSPGPANDGDGDLLFSFSANHLKRLKDGTYLARGTFRHGEVERAVEALVQAPVAHSPFASLTFRLDEAVFPEVWSEFSGRLAAHDPTDGEMRPRAWLLAPLLAAA
jgi:hypothetical protein